MPTCTCQNQTPLTLDLIRAIDKTRDDLFLKIDDNLTSSVNALNDLGFPRNDCWIVVEHWIKQRLPATIL